MNIVNKIDPLSSAINHLIDNALDNIHTILPGTVHSYDGYAAKVDIDLDGYPILLDVPVGFFGSGDITISHKIEKGTTGLILVCERDATQFKIDKENVDRRFDLSDSFFLPFVRPKSKALQTPNDGVYIQSAGGSIHLKDSGECVIDAIKVKTQNIECDTATIGGIDFGTHSHGVSTVIGNNGAPCTGQTEPPT